MITFLAFIILFFMCVFVIDDLFIDLVALVNRLKPTQLTADLLMRMKAKREKQIAIIIANWHEANVIGKMISGNIKNVQYSHYHFFLGVYPNDTETMIAVNNLQAVYPLKVHMIVNHKDGPTSKGQMLNEVIRGVLSFEKEKNLKFDVFLMHDSEDILHPHSLTVINSEIETTDFLQTPVFSFNRPFHQWVGSTYIDEFAEIHTKDLFVRQHLGAPVPSAGTGTALRRQLMLELMMNNQGDFLREDSLTEDYVLGMSAAILGFKTAFVCYYTKVNGKRDYIATREYFPNSFQAAIKQKARWVLGIVFQGQKIVPWFGSWVHKYFLYRDRRGPWNNTVAMATTALTIYLFAHKFFNGMFPHFVNTNWFFCFSVIGTLGMIIRALQRAIAVSQVNGKQNFLLSMLRWPLGNLINFCASVKAVREYHRSKVTRQPLRWSKTTHELPQGFGEENELH